jgi:hypothetical protein
MSLISEALKKAQRMRTSESSASAAPFASGGGTMGRRGRPRATSPVAWIFAGATVVVSLAVVTTVFLLRPAPTALAAAKSASAPPAANTSSATPAAPAVPASVILPAPKPAEPAPAVSEAIAPPAKPATPPPSPSPEPAPAPSGHVPPSVAVVAPTGESKPDLRIQAFVDAIKVTGIRSSGTESKVMMNDHIFRVNDIVDRSLNLRLIEVQSDRLTFVDENRMVYTKNF